MAYVFRDPAGLARTAILWTYTWIGAQMLSLASSIFELSMLSRLPAEAEITMKGSPPQMAVSDMASGFASLIELVTFGVSGFLILKWIYRTNANAQLKDAGMEISPGWAVGWFFVPVGSLWRPFQAVREIWQVSRNPHDWSNVPIPVYFRWWWGLWLSFNFLGNVSFQLARRGTTVDFAAAGGWVNIIADLLAVPLGLCLIQVIRDITVAQDDVFA